MLYDPEKEPREKWGRTPREMGENPARNGGKPREKWGKAPREMGERQNAGSLAP